MNKKKARDMSKNSHIPYGNERPLKTKGGRKKRLCRHMVDIWNKTIPYKLYSESKASLSSKREERLIWFLEEVLGPEHSWEGYCQLIAHHSFLGRVTLDWALMLDNARKIMATATEETRVHPENLENMAWGAFYEEIRKKCQRSPYGAEWFQICQNLAKRLGQGIYKTWFAEASLVDFTKTTVTLQVNNPFIRDYILAYFFLDLAYAVQAAYPLVNRIDFQIRSLKERSSSL
jgi:hypothetical protein